jgi:hypothetical protein
VILVASLILALCLLALSSLDRTQRAPRTPAQQAIDVSARMIDARFRRNAHRKHRAALLSEVRSARRAVISTAPALVFSSARLARSFA